MLTISLKKNKKKHEQQQGKNHSWEHSDSSQYEFSGSNFKIVFKLTLAANLEPKFSIQNILNELCYVICELCI